MIESPLDRLMMVDGATAALLAFRLGGLFLAAPMFSSRAIPIRVRAVALVALTATMIPSVEPLQVAPTPQMFAMETGIGLIIGLAASLYIAGATAAGDLLAIQMGLAGSSTLNPISGESMPILGQFAQLTALTVVLTLGGHLVMIEAIGASLDMAPLGAPIALEGGFAAMANMAGRVFEIALQFAAPVVAALLLGNVVLGVLGRSVPQMNLLMVAFPVQIGIGLLALAASMPILSTLLGNWPFDFEQSVETLMVELSIAGGG